MIKDFADLQAAYFKTVTDNDVSEQRSKLELIIYYIRKHIHSKAVVVIGAFSPGAAAKLQLAKVLVPEVKLLEFALWQSRLISMLGRRGDGIPELWKGYLEWCEELINEEVSRRTSKYIKVSIAVKNIGDLRHRKN